MFSLPAFRAVCLAIISCGAVQADRSSDYIILSFGASWCQPCKEMIGDIERLADEGWLVRQIDVDKEKGVVQRWNVTQVPTLIILRDNREIDRISGRVPASELRLRLPKTNDKATINDSGAKHAAPGLRSTTISSSSPIDPLRSTVRIKIEDGQSTAFGSGTIIDQHGDEALVLTCGHLFRDAQSSSILTVEVPLDGRLVAMPATVVDFRCDETDIGLIAFRPGRPVEVARLLPRGVKLQEKEPVSSFGCDQGAEPSRRDSHITKLNRYIGPSNVEVARAPVQGRSGGGLFNARGELIGVCYAADAEHDEGLYSGPDVVYQQLARLGLERLYDSNPPPLPAPGLAMSTAIPMDPKLTLQSDSFPDRSMGDGWKSAVDRVAQEARVAAANAVASVTQQTGNVSVTAILRDSAGNERLITIPSPSPALLQALQGDANQGESTRMAAR